MEKKGDMGATGVNLLLCEKVKILVKAEKRKTTSREKGVVRKHWGERRGYGKYKFILPNISLRD